MKKYLEIRIFFSIVAFFFFAFVLSFVLYLNLAANLTGCEQLGVDLCIGLAAPEDLRGRSKVARLMPCTVAPTISAALIVPVSVPLPGGHACVPAGTFTVPGTVVPGEGPG